LKFLIAIARYLDENSQSRSREAIGHGPQKLNTQKSMIS